MNIKQLNLLEEQLALLDKSLSVLEYSYKRCTIIKDKSEFNEQDLERFESLTGRFARLSDLLIQKMFRLIDSLDLDDHGTVRDRINRAEKKGLIDSAEQFVLIRELRNTIAHEYDPVASEQVFLHVLEFCPLLFDAVGRLKKYAEKYWE
ncbi:MAG: hypothetical protein DRQ62_04885 [Gammaproteobacteria bacterium]|nr:MAG: hypothetical protein DRQ62_04885 [Gammaproteobacteria bacterium]